MYFKERVFALLIYIFFIFLITTFIKRIKGVRAVLNLYILILSIMGYFYVPFEGADLSRVVITMNAYKYLNINELIEKSKESMAPLAVVYYHLISLLNNDSLLPAINALLSFSFIFAIIKSHYTNYKTSKTSVAISIIFFMSRGLFLQTISNIRTMLAMSILSFCLYKVLYERKKIVAYLPLMLISAMIHVVGLAAVLIFLIYYFVLDIKNFKMKNIIYIPIILLILLKYGKNNLNGAIELGIRYVDVYRLGIGYFYIWEFILSLIVIISTFYTFKKYISPNIEKSISNDDILLSHTNFLKFMRFITCVDLFALLFEFNIGLRLNYLLSILNIPMILCLLNSKVIDERKKKEVNRYIFMISMFMLLISCTRGDLCGLKFS